MKDIRLIATDLDGTLLDSGKKIPPFSMNVIRECLERGIVFMIVSGRCFEDARIPAVETGLPFVIASSNGARIEKTANGPLIYERTMTDQEACACYGILNTCPGIVNSYTNGRIFVRRLPEDRRKEVRYTGMPDRQSEWIYDDIPRMDVQGVKGVYKFEIYSADRALLRDYAERFTAIGMAVTSANPDDIEIQPADSTKGAAVRHMMERMGITKDQVMAFGDYTNDLSMLREAGYGIAMENAVLELRREADIIAPCNDREGEARMIRTIALGKEDTWPVF